MALPRSDLSRIRGIVFDAFGTTCRGGPLSKFVPWHESLPRAARQRLLDRWMAGEIGPAELIASGDRRQAPPLDVMARALEVGLDEVHAYPDVPPVLQALSRRGYRLVTASNLVAPFGHALERELGAWMDGFALSYEVGALKPNRRMFEAAAGHLQMAADQILVVGDSVADDVEGAHALGMASIQVDRSGTVAYTIASLEPLLSLLSEPADAKPPHF